MIDPLYWQEEWRNYPHGPDASRVWILRRDGEAADHPFQTLAEFHSTGGDAAAESVGPPVPPLGAVARAVASGRVEVDDGAPASFVAPVRGGRTVGAVAVRHGPRRPWDEAVRCWSRGLARRLAPLLDHLPRNARAVADAPQQGELFPRSPDEVPRTRRRDRLPLPVPRRVPGIPGLVAASGEMTDCCAAALAVAGSEVNVLLHGESGTGKEVLARAIHDTGRRRDGPFVAVNCAALPETLFESELFGHKAGSFTGAGREKTGLLEAAHKGTFFLDEIGDMPVSLQIKLLRVMQEKALRRIGDLNDRPVDVRFVAASHRDLDAEIDAGRFRLDLYYRLKVVGLEIPALRARPEDIAPLIAHFLERRGRDLDGLHLRREALDAMQRYRWPGNVRELENEVGRWLALHGGEREIRLEHLSLAVRKARDPSEDPADLGTLRPLDEASALLERHLIRKAIGAAGGRKSDAARTLGLSRQGLYKKIRRYRMLDLLQPAR